MIGRPRLHVLHGSRSEDGRKVLDDVHRFLGFFLAYPSEAAHIAHTLWVAHAHAMDAWETTPRLAFLSAERGSGKTRGMELTELLVPHPVMTVNSTPAYLFRRVAHPAGATVLFDEIDTIFGPAARGNEELRALINAGHRRGAIVGRCTVQGKEVVTEEFPAYSAVALAGLGDLPDTILSRSVIIRMNKRAPDERVASFRVRTHTKEGHALRDRLAAWSGAIIGTLAAARPAMPEGIADRAADVWEPLLAIADAVGGDWPERARVSAVSFVSVYAEEGGSLGVRLLSDLRDVFGEREHMTTAEILAGLYALPESMWSEIRGKPLSDRALARTLRPYAIKPKTLRTGAATARGYERADLADAWSRYLPASSSGSKTAETAETTGDETDDA